MIVKMSRKKTKAQKKADVSGCTRINHIVTEVCRILFFYEMTCKKCLNLLIIERYTTLAAEGKRREHVKGYIRCGANRKYLCLSDGACADPVAHETI